MGGGSKIKSSPSQEYPAVGHPERIVPDVAIAIRRTDRPTGGRGNTTGADGVAVAAERNGLQSRAALPSKGWCGQGLVWARVGVGKGWYGQASALDCIELH